MSKILNNLKKTSLKYALPITLFVLILIGVYIQSFENVGYQRSIYLVSLIGGILMAILVYLISTKFENNTNTISKYDGALSFVNNLLQVLALSIAAFFFIDSNVTNEYFNFTDIQIEGVVYEQVSFKNEEGQDSIDFAPIPVEDKLQLEISFYMNDSTSSYKTINIISPGGVIDKNTKVHKDTKYYSISTKTEDRSAFQLNANINNAITLFNPPLYLAPVAIRKPLASGN